MRRTVTVFMLAIVAAATFAVAAAAKEGGVELSTTPAGTKPGEPWTPNLILVDGTPEMLAQAEPGIQITNLDTGRQLHFAAKAADKYGAYTVEVVFPEAGTWTYAAYDGVTGRMYEFPPVEITGPPVAAVKTRSAPSEGGAFPVWTLIGGLSALALACAGAALAVRRYRLRPSH